MCSRTQSQVYGGVLASLVVSLWAQFVLKLGITSPSQAEVRARVLRKCLGLVLGEISRFPEMGTQAQGALGWKGQTTVETEPGPWL